MKRLILIVWMAFAGVGLLTAQSPDDLNEGAKAEWDAANSIWRLKWWGKAGRTYFIQHSSDLNLAWEWLPVVEAGEDAVKQGALTTTGDRSFLRLRYSDIPTSDPQGADFDADGLSNLAEVQAGANPFNPDSNDDGIIDGISLALGIGPTQTGYSLADSDNDGLDNFSEIILGLNPENSSDGQNYNGFPAGSPYGGSFIIPDASDETLPAREPVNASDSDNDGWSDEDDASSYDPSSGAPSPIEIDFYGSSDAAFEAWRPVLEHTVTGRTYIYRISGQVNYQNTSSGHYKDYGYVLDQGPYRENALHWQSPVTFLDLDGGSPSSDHSYYVMQTGTGSAQACRPQDVKSQDVWSPGGGGPNGVADSYEDNSGSLGIEVIRPKLRAVKYVAYDDEWRPEDPNAEPAWEIFPQDGMLFTGDDVTFEVDLGTAALNDEIVSVNCYIATQDGPGSGTLYGSVVPGEPAQAQFFNLQLAGQVHVVAEVELAGHSIMVDDFVEVGIRTKSVSVIQWLDPAGIQPRIPLPTCVVWVMAKVGSLPATMIPNVLAALDDDACRLAASEWILDIAPDAPPGGGQNFADPQEIVAFLNASDSLFRLGNTFRKKFSPYKAGNAWTMRGTGASSYPVRVAAGHTQVPVLSAETLAEAVRDWTVAYFLMGTEEHPVNFGALRTNASNGNEQTRLSAAARVGKLGQFVNSLIWPNDVPWIFSNVTFDAGDVEGLPVETPNTSVFPRAYIYHDGVLVQQIQQSSVETFLQTWDSSLPTIEP